MKIVMLGSGSYKSSLTYFRLVALGQQLGCLGWDVSLIVPAADKYNDFTPDWQATLKHIELVQPWQPATRRPLFNLLPYLISASLAVLRRPAQLVYIYKPTPITIIGLLPKLLRRTPTILDLDDLGSEVMRGEGRPGLSVRLVAACERLALRQATAVVVASQYLARQVRDRYPDKPVLVLSNGVDPEEFVAPELQSKPRPAIYYFGALNRLALIQPLLVSLPEVIRVVPETQVTIFGGGQALNEAKALVQKLKLNGAVTFTGWVKPEAVQQAVAVGDIAVCIQPDIPTVHAASNLKVFQYMALGSVPVVSDVGDLKHYLQTADGPLGVVVPAGQSEKLSAALSDLLQDPKRRVRLAARARRQAERRYAWSVLAGQLDGFLRQQVKVAALEPELEANS
jgi:glycosyltransferase involved in cell wall biosynthesis